MPIYTMNCVRDTHTFTVPMSVPLFRARRDEAKENKGLFKHIQCPRCKRKGTCVHDAIGDMRTQATHDGNYTFYDNAPDAILRGERERTVSNTEAKALMKEFGLADAGKEGKREFPPEGSEREAIKQRWATETVEREERERLERVRLAAEKLLAPEPTDTHECELVVDSEEPPVDTIAALSWKKLRRKARSLKVENWMRLKRPGLEAAVRTKLAEQVAK